MAEETPVDPVKEEADALGRIALTHDGLLLHRYLRRVLEGVIVTPDSGALRDHNGRRTLARDLMAHMAKSIEANSGGRTDQSLLSARASGVAVSGGSTRRRGALTDGDGWKPDGDT